MVTKGVINNVDEVRLMSPPSEELPISGRLATNRSPTDRLCVFQCDCKVLDMH